ncbi:MAG: BrxA family protein, partial [Mycobacterium sp.]
MHARLPCPPGDHGYRLSFTTGGLLRAEAVAIARVLLTAADPATARAEAQERNLVQQRTSASTARVTREVVQRVTQLPTEGVELVAHGPVSDAGHLMWLAACLRYRFLRDFGREVIRGRYVSGQTF